MRRELAPIAATGSTGTSDMTAVPIEPGARRIFTLEFRTEATGDPRELAPFAVNLVFGYGKRDLPMQVAFVREEYPRYHGRHYHPYYQPYYDGYPAMYWRPRFGWSVGYGWGW